MHGYIYIHTHVGRQAAGDYEPRQGQEKLATPAATGLVLPEEEQVPGTRQSEQFRGSDRPSAAGEEEAAAWLRSAVEDGMIATQVLIVSEVSLV